MTFKAAIELTTRVELADEIKDLAIELLSENGYEIGEYNPHHVSAFLVTIDNQQYIAVASNEDEALDVLVNENLLDAFLCDNFDADDIDEEFTFRAGNASELFCYDYFVRFQKIIQA